MEFLIRNHIIFFDINIIQLTKVDGHRLLCIVSFSFFVADQVQGSTPLLSSLSGARFGAAETKGSMTYAFTRMGNFLLLPPSFSYPPFPLGPNPSLETKIPTSWSSFQPQGPNPRGKAQIPAQRPKYQPLQAIRI